MLIGLISGGLGDPIRESDRVCIVEDESNEDDENGENIMRVCCSL
jgi:hypothetical protein